MDWGRLSSHAHPNNWKKKPVKCLLHEELSRYCKKQILGITIGSIYRHNINVTHPKRTHFSFLSLTMTASKKYLLPLPLQTSDLWASPNLLPLHKTPTRSYPVCQQALRDMNSSQIMQKRNWMNFSNGHVFTRRVFPRVRLELRKWACLIALYFKSEMNF